jgi:hypothetical protein
MPAIEILVVPHSMPAAVSAISVAPLSLNNDHAAAAGVNSTSALVVPNTKVNNQLSPEQFEIFLKHLLDCSGGENCFIKNSPCALLQSILDHARSDCKIENCQQCIHYYDTVLSRHASACSNDACQVPRCLKIRYVKRSIVIDLTLD